jgi:hypothetical protein
MRTVLAFLAGALVSYVAVVAGAFLYMDLADVFDRDGGMAMAVMFAFGPIGALVGGTAAAIGAALYRRARPRQVRDEGAAATPSSRQNRIVLAAAIAGIAGYLLGSLGLWLQSGASYASYSTALLISWAPYLLALSAGGLAAWLASRSPARA